MSTPWGKAPIGEYPLARDGHAVLLGRTSEPVIAGSMMLTETRRGSVVMNYEVYGNSYRVFAFLFPRPRIDIRRPLRMQWER